LTEHFDTSGKSAVFSHYSEIPYAQILYALVARSSGRVRRVAAEKSSSTSKIAPDRRRPSDRLRVPNRALAACACRGPQHGHRSRPTTTTAIAATDQAKAAAAPRIKFLSHGFSIDHPDPEIGEQLMADALGWPTATRCMALSGNW